MRKLALFFLILLVNTASAETDYIPLTLTQGEETSRSLTFTNSGTYDALSAWASATGDASSWVSPSYLEFGVIYPGETSSKYSYTLRVPEYQSPGYYELRWRWGCKYISGGQTCTVTGDTVLQITVKAKPVPTPVKQEYGFTLTQGEELTRYLTWTGAYERSFASAEASGDAASWVTPRRLDFGAVDTNDRVEKDYVIKVPKNQRPGYYELRWKYSCKYVSGKTCSPTNDVVLQITVKGRTVPTPTPVEPSYPSYISLTVTQGGELSEYLTFTNYDAYDTLYGWADASGDAASWVTPGRIDFGAIAPGETGSGYYAIRVPEYISSGYYELRWKWGCKYASGKTCPVTGDTVLQITVETKPMYTPIPIEPSEDGTSAVFGLILIIAFIAIIVIALKGRKPRYEAPEVQEPGYYKPRRRIGGRFQK